MKMQFAVMVVIDTDSDNRPPTSAQLMSNPDDPNERLWIIGIGKDIAKVAKVNKVDSLVPAAIAHEFGHVINHEVIKIGWKATWDDLMKDEHGAWDLALHSFEALRKNGIDSYAKENDPEKQARFLEHQGRTLVAMPTAFEQLRDALKGAQAAHQAKFGDGAEFDQSWADFYAGYILQRVDVCEPNRGWVNPSSYSKPLTLSDM